MSDVYVEVFRHALVAVAPRYLLIYQITSIPYRAKIASDVTTIASSDKAWAMTRRSKGSR